MVLTQKVGKRVMCIVGNMYEQTKHKQVYIGGRFTFRALL